MSDINLQKRNEQLERLHRANKIFFWLIIVMAVFNITYLIVKGDSSCDVIAFRGVQYVAMLLIMLLPKLLKKHLKIEVPWVLYIAVVIFCFSALILGDGLDLYGKLPWWDKLLHSESGILLSLIALWLIHIVMAENDKYIYLNRWFLAIFLVMFSLGLGACWEIMEFTYDSLMGTNTQQFMATTTGSIYTPEDIPLCGHDALKDSMGDLILDLLGALTVAIYGFINHDKLLKRYYTDAHIDGRL